MNPNGEPERMGAETGYNHLINELRREIAELRDKNENLSPSVVITTSPDVDDIHLSSKLTSGLTEATRAIVRGHLKAKRINGYDSSTSAVKYAGDRRPEAVFLVLDPEVYRTIVEPVLDQAERDGLLDIETTIS